MAFPTIETDYKPDGALGALYSGFNAANADQAAQLELIKAALANQREQQIQPYDVNIKSAESARADVQKLPEMLDAYKRLYMGQADSTQAAGNKAMGTWQGEADLTNANNDNSLWSAKNLARINQLKQATIDAAANGGSIGFPMQSQTPTGSGPTGKFTGNPLQIFNQLKNAKFQNPQDRDLAFQAFENQFGHGITQQLNANNSPIVQQAPLRNGGINLGSPEYEARMQAEVDTPKLRQELIRGDQKLDSAEYLKQLQLEAEYQKLAARAAQITAKLPTLEQATVQDILDRKARGIITPAQASEEIYAFLNKKFDKPLQQGITGKMEDGKIVLGDKENPTPIKPQTEKSADLSGTTSSGVKFKVIGQ